MNLGDEAFVAYPDAVLYLEKPGVAGRKALNHVIWGDWLKIQQIDDNDIKVRCRRTTGWIKKNQIRDRRILEVNFVDIGQGDGCHIVTPDDRALIIDAGEGDNMYRFLRWRYGRFAKEFTFDAAIITHPDQDHYQGFQPLFEESNLRFDHLYYNGIVERVPTQEAQGEGPIGFVEKDLATGRRYVKPVSGLNELKAITDNATRVGRRKFPKLLKTAIDSGRVGDFEWLRAEEGSVRYVPGYTASQSLRLKILSPVPDVDASGNLRLRSFGDDGKTKNGHSVVLRLEYGDVAMFLGGDLNIPAEEYLLGHYTGLPLPPEEPTTDEERKKLTEFLEKARQTFQADVAKACHHGSADFSAILLESVNPIVTVVSSGDDESHSHPRPDTLGALGRHGRGHRPLIFSTELARSAKETIKRPNVLREELNDLVKVLEDPTASENDKDKARKKRNGLLRKIERSVSVYGMINVRTDGERVMIAQRLERPKSNKKWDLYRLEPENGELVYQSKH